MTPEQYYLGESGQPLMAVSPPELDQPPMDESGLSLRLGNPFLAADSGLKFGRSLPSQAQTEVSSSPSSSGSWTDWLMPLAGALEGFGAGFRGHPPAAFHLRQILSAEKQRAEQRTTQAAVAKEQARRDTIKLFMDYATNLSPEQQKQLAPAVEALVKETHPDLVPLFRGIHDKPEGLQNAVDAVEQHPLDVAAFRAINETAQSLPAKERTKFIASARLHYLQAPETHKAHTLFNEEEISSRLSALSDDQKAALKGASFDRFLAAAEKMTDESGQPLPPRLLRELRRPSKELQDILGGYGIQTPQLVEKQAAGAASAAARDEEKYANDVAVISKGRYKTYAEAPVDIKDQAKQREAERSPTAKITIQQEALQAPLNEAEEKQAQAIAAYRRAPIDQYALMRPGSRGIAIMARVEDIHKEKGTAYDAATWPRRVQTIEAFARGPQSNLVRSLNVVEDHILVMRGLARAMKNNDVRAFNAVKQWIAQSLGQPEPRSFDEARRILGEETGKALINAGGSAAERDAFMNAITKADSPQAIEAVLNTREKLLAGQLSGLRRQYTAGTGLTDRDFEQLLSPQAINALKPLEQRAAPSKPPFSQSRYDALIRQGKTKEQAFEIMANE